ncbi:fatty acyl-CoA reductase [Aspergillus mulundensis]|uniref:Fatty acyl-CoA reductase n=1 Tax=Aspergillus mulundensis TaxID=1810919 RepID=A0A3D8QBK0_9EURO|nr:Fatty acyl-CoA reductase [Aspergillus mulundensis]RDW58988.1 Fatty acyl-CoA reductase [Aspergillus mulundensis]
MALQMVSANEDEVKKKGYATAFEAHTVFLTGSTGSLGGCLLYKLALQLPTRKIFVLVRKSSETAVKKWKRSMPGQTQALLESKKIHFVIGDIREPDLGMDAGSLERLKDEVTLVIHTAAKISLDSDITEALENNCFPSLELARLASSFRRLKLFIQLSTSYANSFLPDGHIGERLYDYSDEDCEEEIASIQQAGDSPHTSRFSSSYTHSKHLMERLMLRRYPTLPLLFVRPTIFARALRHPFPLYGIDGSHPMDKFADLLISDRGGKQTWHATEGYESGVNILDEIPVDFVANACLLHAAAKTRGIVQIGSELYVQRTYDDFLHLLRDHVPPEVRGQLPEITFVQDRSIPQHWLAELVKVASRNWIFDCGRSYWLKQVGGPLSLAACEHDANHLNITRVEDISKKNMKQMAKL